MNYVEAPDMPLTVMKPIVFLAGGITGCPEWQKEVIAKLANVEEGTVFNPRKLSFDLSQPKEAISQIRWEAQWLWTSEIVTFWFCKETVCPITLFELGCHLVRSRLAKVNIPHICIGIEPGYTREFDIREQVKIITPEVPIVNSLDGIVDFITENVKILSEENK